MQVVLGLVMSVYRRAVDDVRALAVKQVIDGSVGVYLVGAMIPVRHDNHEFLSQTRAHLHRLEYLLVLFEHRLERQLELAHDEYRVNGICGECLPRKHGILIRRRAARCVAE